MASEKNGPSAPPEPKDNSEAISDPSGPFASCRICGRPAVVEIGRCLNCGFEIAAEKAKADEKTEAARAVDPAKPKEVADGRDV